MGLIINAALIAAAAYFFVGAVDPGAAPTSIGQVGRGMPRDDVISLNGSPDITIRGSAGRPIDKFKTSGGRTLYVFYDEDTRVSSYFSRRY